MNAVVTSQGAGSAVDGLPMPARLGAIFAIAFGIAMAVLDGALVNVALPTIAADFNTSPASSIWIVNAYQLAITMTLLSLSSLGDIVGYRRVYLVGLVLFTLMSVVCALADSLPTLTLARILQGLAAAALMSVNTALIRLIYPKDKLGRGMAINSLVVAVSTAAGPTIAAGILGVASWQWLFAINVPFGIVALLLGWRFLPRNDGVRAQRFDAPSALLNALTFGLFFIALGGFAQGQNLWQVLGELALTLLVGGYFVRRQLSQSYPLLPVDLLRIPVFALSVGTSVSSFCAQMLAMVSLPFYFQSALGMNEIETGLLLTPWPLAIMAVAPLAGRWLERVNAGVLCTIGLSLFALGLFSLAWLPASPGYLDICLRMVLCGIGFGLFQSPNNHTIISAAPRHRSGGASGMLGTARLVGQTAGAALVALMFNLFGGQGTHAALITAGVFAALAAVVSGQRISRLAAAP
ncbi:MFS transporter [Dickeya dianthicola]|uniref:MFS transporter n=1 Tax=Dickeya dianthicola TaxID=204039 RepID=A0ABX9NRS0_9GAMM|nr:MFS transporter [Dickeya dianthicola]MBI0450523.1 MFS transporter [Dickeya dianthicola]MBI0455091.1 MFS transporter [Dickeya dianthicola]MBI0459271.1 MFS transporter [Dickeya dianthicola]MBI0463062.1 MFS transporter [Dickeya dianthicola]